MAGIIEEVRGILAEYRRPRVAKPNKVKNGGAGDDDDDDKSCDGSMSKRRLGDARGARDGRGIRGTRGSGQGRRSRDDDDDDSCDDSMSKKRLGDARGARDGQGIRGTRGSGHGRRGRGQGRGREEAKAEGKYQAKTPLEKSVAEMVRGQSGLWITEPQMKGIIAALHKKGITKPGKDAYDDIARAAGAFISKNRKGEDFDGDVERALTFEERAAVLEVIDEAMIGGYEIPTPKSLGQVSSRLSMNQMIDMLDAIDDIRVVAKMSVADRKLWNQIKSRNPDKAGLKTMKAIRELWQRYIVKAKTEGADSSIKEFEARLVVYQKRNKQKPGLWDDDIRETENMIKRLKSGKPLTRAQRGLPQEGVDDERGDFSAVIEEVRGILDGPSI